MSVLLLNVQINIKPEQAWRRGVSKWKLAWRSIIASSGVIRVIYDDATCLKNAGYMSNLVTKSSDTLMTSAAMWRLVASIATH